MTVFVLKLSFWPAVGQLVEAVEQEPSEVQVVYTWSQERPVIELRGGKSAVESVAARLASRAAPAARRPVTG